MLHLTSSDDRATTINAPKASTLLTDRVISGGSDVARVYNEIFDAIVDGRLMPGMRLTESALCNAFSCTRATVRAALLQLAHDRIVTTKPNRGAFVWKPSAKEASDIFEMRRGVESLVLDMLVAKQVGAQDLRPLYDMVKQEQHAFSLGDRISWVRLSNAFHVQMSRLLGNHVLTETLHSLCARTTLIIAHYDTPGASSCSWLEHNQVLDHLVRGDANAAKAAMHDHLHGCEHRMNSLDQAPSTDPWTIFHQIR